MTQKDLPKFHLLDLAEIVGLLLLLVGALLPLLHIDDAMNLVDVTCHTLLCFQTLKQTSAELITSPPSLKNIPTEVMHNVSDLHGLLLLVLLAVHSVVALKLTWPKCFYKCWKYKKDFDVNNRDHSISYQRWKKFQLKWYIQILANSLVFSSLLSLLFIVSSTSSHVRNVFTNAKNIKRLWCQPSLPEHITS